MRGRAARPLTSWLGTRLHQRAPWARTLCSPQPTGTRRWAGSPRAFFLPFSTPPWDSGADSHPGRTVWGRDAALARCGGHGGGGRVLQPRAVPPLAGQPLVGLVQSIARLAW